MNLIDGIRKNNFVVIGRVGIDFCPDPPGTPIENARNAIVGMGGSAANISAGICKFGGKASLVTRVSDDAIGRYCVNQLDAYGIDASHVHPVAGEYRNSLAFFESIVEGHQSVIYRNGAADFQMNVEDVEAVDYSKFGALITAGTVFAAEPSRSATFRAFELAHAAGIPIIFDIDYRPYSWPSAEIASDVLSRAGEMSDMIVGNDEEFGFMAGDIDRGLAKAEELSAKNASVVIYKMGENGAITFADGQRIQTGIYPVNALKPTGAGDSFLAGLIAALASGSEIREAIMRGSACASIVVGKPGCAAAMPGPEELGAFLASHPGPTNNKHQSAI